MICHRGGWFTSKPSAGSKQGCLKPWLVTYAPSAVILDSRTLQSTPESGGCAVYDEAKRPMGSKTHMAVDTLGDLLALLVTPANEQDRDQVQQLTQKIEEVTDETVEVAFVDKGYTLLL